MISPQGDASTTAGTKEVDSKVKEEKKGAFESKEAQDAQSRVSDTKAILDPMSTATTTTIKSLSTSKRSTHALGSSTSESDEESRSDDSRQVMSARTQKTKLLQADLQLWGLPLYALRNKLPDRASVQFDGDQKKWVSFAHHLRVCLQSRGSQYVALLGKQPQAITTKCWLSYLTNSLSYLQQNNNKE